MDSLILKYDKLTKVRLLFEVNRKEYIIQFSPVHFKHLIGIQHLTDLPGVENNASGFYRRCKSGKVSIDYLKQSKHWSLKVHERILILENILEILLKCNVLNKKEYKLMYLGSKVRSDITLVFDIVHIKYNFAFLHLKYDEGSKVYHPISLYCVNEEEYIKRTRMNNVKNRNVYSWKIIAR